MSTKNKSSFWIFGVVVLVFALFIIAMKAPTQDPSAPYFLCKTFPLPGDDRYCEQKSSWTIELKMFEYSHDDLSQTPDSLDPEIILYIESIFFFAQQNNIEIQNVMISQYSVKSRHPLVSFCTKKTVSKEQIISVLNSMSIRKNKKPIISAFYFLFTFLKVFK